MCSVYAVEEEDGLPVIVMEYVDGRPLSGAIAEALPAQLALDLGRQIAAGLAAAHQQQVVHGDLKPANIMITPERRAKILDFGLARSERAARASGGTAKPATAASSAAVSTDLEHAGVAETLDRDMAISASETAIRGTPAYMSPEQASGAISASPSDIFSLGIVLFEMLTGQQPYGQRSAIQLVTHLQTADIAAELVPRVAPDYQPLLHRMLQTDPALRPSADQVRQELVELLADW